MGGGNVELKLATRLGVSRGSIREAIRELIEQGLLVSKPYGGTYVTTIAEAKVTRLPPVRFEKPMEEVSPISTEIRL